MIPSQQKVLKIWRRTKSIQPDLDYFNKIKVALPIGIAFFYYHMVIIVKYHHIGSKPPAHEICT